MASTAQVQAAPARAGWQPAARALLGIVGRWYSVAVVLLLWELIARSGLVNPRLFPSLEVIWDQLVLLASRGTLWNHLAATLIRVGAGFGLACVGGVLLGLAMARVRWVDRLFEPLFSWLPHPARSAVPGVRVPVRAGAPVEDRDDRPGVPVPDRGEHLLRHARGERALRVGGAQHGRQRGAGVL